jgi:hypothetical protein
MSDTKKVLLRAGAIAITFTSTSLYALLAEGPLWLFPVVHALSVLGAGLSTWAMLERFRWLP